MARPLKSGIDYFPLDVVLSDRFELIVAKYRSDGFTVLIRLFQHIYSGYGYYCDWNEETCMLFSYKNGLNNSITEKIVDSAVTRGIFDSAIYNSLGVLTSRGIQRRYFEIVSRRKILCLRRELLLIDVVASCKNVVINFVDDDIKAKDAGINPQRKVKKSKAKQSRVECSIVASPTLLSPELSDTPSLQQVTDYCKSRRSMVDPRRFYEYFSEGGWRDSNGKRVINWKQKLITWEKQDGTAIDKPPDVMQKRLTVPDFNRTNKV